MLTLYIADVERDAGMKKLSRKEAAKVLDDMKVKIEIPKAAVMQWKRNAALDMAITALNCSEIPNNSDTISRQAAIETLTRLEPSFRGSVLEQALKNMPPAQPTYTDEEIQKMQDLESAEIEKAYQLGYEEGKKDARAEQKMGRWTVKRLYIKCSECGDCFPLKPQNYCPNCGADMRGDEYD